jgi:UDP-2-acetamido-3-amino-2,3-dideoxy-glucuronate N-acetyltransferase
LAELLKVECENGYYYRHPEAYVDEGASIGPETKIWAGAHIFDGAQVGANSVIGAGVHIEGGAELGDFGKVQRGVTIYKGVRAAEYVFFGPNATTTNDRNPRAFGNWDLSETIIEAGASIGANATLIAGTRVGPLALVGAAANVTRDVPGGQLVLGNPARFAGWVNVEGKVISRDEEMPEDITRLLADPVAAIAEFIRKEGE